MTPAILIVIDMLDEFFAAGPHSEVCSEDAGKCGFICGDANQIDTVESHNLGLIKWQHN